MTQFNPYKCVRSNCPGHLVRVVDGPTIGTGGGIVFRCDFCYALSNEEFEKKLKELTPDPANPKTFLDLTVKIDAANLSKRIKNRIIYLLDSPTYEDRIKISSYIDCLDLVNEEIQMEVSKLQQKT